MYVNGWKNTCYTFFLDIHFSTLKNVLENQPYYKKWKIIFEFLFKHNPSSSIHTKKEFVEIGFNF